MINDESSENVRLPIYEIIGIFWGLVKNRDKIIYYGSSTGPASSFGEVAFFSRILASSLARSI